MKTSHIAFIALLTLSSCNRSYEAESAPGFFKADEKQESSADIAGSVNFTSPEVSGPEEQKNGNDKGIDLEKKESSIKIKTPQKIRKTANLNFTVEDYASSRAKIEKLVKSKNGYISNENEQKNTYSISNDMVIRVENKDFDILMTELLTVAKEINSKNVYVDDVTAQFVDIQSRLRSKKEIENRYLTLLSKAQKVSDILEIEEKLGEIREEIEAKEGQLKLLSDQVDYSTINLNIHQDFEYTPSEHPGFWGRMGNALGNGWNGFLSFIIGIVYIWPLWLILSIITFAVVKVIKKRLKK